MLPKMRHIQFDFHMSHSPQSLWSVLSSLVSLWDTFAVIFCILGSLGIWFSQREKNGIGLRRSLVTSLLHLLPHWPLPRWTRWPPLPGHQNSGAPPFFSGFSWWCTLIYAGSVPIKTGNVENTKIHLGKKTNWYSWCQFSRLYKIPIVNLK